MAAFISDVDVNLRRMEIVHTVPSVPERSEEECLCRAHSAHYILFLIYLMNRAVFAFDYAIVRKDVLNLVKKFIGQ